MRRRQSWRSGALALVAGLVGAGSALGAPAPAPSSEVARIDLSKPFGTRSAWRLVATQGPATEDYGGNPAPGALHLCFETGAAGRCASDPDPMPPRRSGDASDDWAPHYLGVAKPVYPQGRSAPPLLMVVTGSLHAGDGDQVVATQLFQYSPAADRFERVYAHVTGSNNNQEVRFVDNGPLQGDVISAEPTADAPYGYWVEVDRLAPGRGYRQVLRYRSATRYGDGNPLAVVDAEMPNIELRLGLWKAGAPLPLPRGSKPCPRPHLKRGALWCQ